MSASVIVEVVVANDPRGSVEVSVTVTVVTVVSAVVILVVFNF